MKETELIFHPLKHNSIKILNELLEKGIPPDITINHNNSDYFFFEFLIDNISSVRNSNTFDQIIESIQKFNFNFKITNNTPLSKIIFSDNVSLNTFNNIKQYFSNIDYDTILDKLLLKDYFDSNLLINKINKLENINFDILKESVISNPHLEYLNIKDPVFNIFHNNKVFNSLTCEELDLLKSKGVNFNNEIILNLAVTNNDLKLDTLYYLINEVQTIDKYSEDIFHQILIKKIPNEDKISILNNFFDKNINNDIDNNPDTISWILSTDNIIQNYIFNHKNIDMLKIANIFLDSSFYKIQKNYIINQNYIEHFEESFDSTINNRLRIFESIINYIPIDQRQSLDIKSIIQIRQKENFSKIFPEKYVNEFFEKFNNIYQRLLLNDIISDKVTIPKKNNRL